jgi:hypothetical protein
MGLGQLGLPVMAAIWLGGFHIKSANIFFLQIRELGFSLGLF